MAIKLKKIGYIIGGIVSSGKAALTYISSEKPDLILMDIAIKGSMDGITTAVKIREVEDIPIVYLTAYADDENLERATQTNCYGYLLKPFKDRELHATIKVALKKYHEKTEIQNSLKEAVNQYSSKDNDIHIDNLTKLPNRLFLRDLFEHLLSKHENPLVSQSQAQEIEERTKKATSRINKNILGNQQK